MTASILLRCLPSVAASTLALFFLAPLSSAQLSASDKALAPRRISTAEELVYLNKFPRGSFQLVNDIDLAGVPFQPIGTVASPFTGRLFGAGHKISNLVINACPEPADYFDFLDQDRIGFFGVTDGALIDDLHLVNVSIAGDETVGGLVAQAQNTVLRSCSVTGEVRGRIQVGGLVGLLGNSDATNCWTDTTVNLCEPLILPGKWHGGLVGHVHPFRFPGRDPSNTGDGSNLRNCYTRGATRGHYVAGGLAGNFHGSYAENCFAYGPVQSEHGFSGGLVGYIQNEPGIGDNPLPLATTIVDCQASGEILSESFGSISELTQLGIWNFGAGVSPIPSSGGFVGYVEGGLDADGSFPNVILEKCIARGDVTTLELNPGLNLPTAGFAGFTEIETFIAFSKSTGDVIAENQTSSGGFVGWGEGVIEDSTSHGDVVAYNRSGAFGGQCAAIRQAVQGNPGPFGGKFRRCVGYGDFRSTDPDSNSLVGVGGFIGYLFSDVEIVDCSAYGSVTTLGGWAGGFVGHSARNLIERCASFGPVFTHGRNCGGFLGRTRLAAGTILRDCASHSEVIYVGPTEIDDLSQTNLGGFIGSAEVATSIFNCYAVGTVVADGGSTIGGFVGASNLMTINGCYYDTEATHQSGPQPFGVSPRSTTQMWTQGNYVSWNFTDVWDIEEGEAYPFLR